MAAGSAWLRGRFPANRLLEYAAWSAPFAVYVVEQRYPDARLLQLIGATLGVLAVAWFSGRPGLTATILVAGFPFAEIVLPLFLRAGAGGQLVRAAGYWKEGLTAALVVAAVQHRRREPVHLDRLDMLALSFAAVIGLYFVFPHWLPQGGLVVPSDAKLGAARAMGLPIVALMAARHAGIDEAWRARILRAAVVAGLVLSVAAIVEIQFTSWWEHFLDDILQVDRYQRVLFNDTARRHLIFSDPSLSGHGTQRAATLYASPLNTAFALLLPLSISLHALARHARTTAGIAIAGLIAVGLALTQTRSALIGAVAIAIGVVRARRGVSTSRRVALALWFSLAALTIVPLVAGTSLGARVTSAIRGTDEQSTSTHQERTETAFDRVTEFPLGQGLGSAGATAKRYSVRGFLLPENYYLLVGLEVGVAGTVLFVGLVATAARRAGAGSHMGDGLLEASAASALVGLAVTGFFLDSFDTITGAMPLMVFLGCAVVPVASRTGEPARL
jgi:hypothetical protein